MTHSYAYALKHALACYTFARSHAHTHTRRTTHTDTKHTNILIHVGTHIQTHA